MSNQHQYHRYATAAEIAIARALYRTEFGDQDIQIDDDAVVSTPRLAEPALGVWISAWVFVPNED